MEEDEDRIVYSIELWRTGAGAWYFDVEWDGNPMASAGSGSYDTPEEALADALVVAERRAI